MRNDQYPSGTVRALLQTDLVKQPAKKVLTDRLNREKVIDPVFFDSINFRIVTSVCKRLIPQPNRSEMIDLAGLLDEELSSGKGNGWRYSQMPPDKIVYTKGFCGINETAELMFGKEFIFLTEKEQDSVLTAIQSGTATGRTWQEMPADIFFKELLASLVELYYSHPFAKEEIGEAAFADAGGWQKTGLNSLEFYEPAAIKKVGDDK